MKLFKRKDKRSGIEKEIDDVLKMMDTLSVTGPEYGKLVVVLDQLMKADSYDNTRKPKFDWNIIIPCVFTLAEILTMLNYEYLHTITSKAISRIPKGRV